MFITVKKKSIQFSLIFAVLMLAMIVVARTPASEGELVRKYLKELGFGTEIYPVETSGITIPSKFNSTYQYYNELQCQAGFDLEMYKGVVCTRYTFVINSPQVLSGMKVNVLVENRKIIGGDIATENIDGVLLPLHDAQVLCEEKSRWSFN